MNYYELATGVENAFKDLNLFENKLTKLQGELDE